MTFKTMLTAVLLAGVVAMPAMAAEKHKGKVKAEHGPAPVVVNVKLWDKNVGSLDMSKNMGLGLGMKADMTKAPMGIEIDKTTVTAGKVTFEVTNVSKDTVHEVIVSPISDVNETMPYLNNENRVDEEHGSHLGEVSELDPGKSGALTVALKPGLYLLYCNIPQHYMDGMWTVLSVK